LAAPEGQALGGLQQARADERDEAGTRTGAKKKDAAGVDAASQRVCNIEKGLEPVDVRRSDANEDDEPYCAYKGAKGADPNDEKSQRDADNETGSQFNDIRVICHGSSPQPGEETTPNQDTPFAR
jgi:hypothetical protein